MAHYSRDAEDGSQQASALIQGLRSGPPREMICDFKSSSRRILMLTGEYPPQVGGVGDYTAQLVTALRGPDHDVTVLTGTVPGAASNVEPPARRWVRDWGFGCWPLIELALHEAEAELLHIQYQTWAYQRKLAINLLPLWLRRRRPGLRVVTTFHDLGAPYLFPKAGPLRDLSIQLILRSSDGAIFADSADFARVRARRNHRWIPIGSNIPCAPSASFDRAATRRALGGGEGETLVGYFGFVKPNKGPQALLRALRLLLDEGRPTRLALLGAAVGPSNPTDREHYSATSALANQLGVGARVRSSGYLTPPEVSAHLLACDVLVLPFADGASFRRGSLLAAMEHGLPIVTTVPAPAACGLGQRILKPDQHFLAVPASDPAALAEAIARLVDDPQLAARLGAEARTLAAGCSWTAIARETAEVYADCFT